MHVFINESKKQVLTERLRKKKRKHVEMGVIVLVEVVFAQINDEKDLIDIMMDYGMGIPGEIEEQLIVKKDREIIAGGKVIQYDDKSFFLEVLAVKEEFKGKGYGRILLKKFLTSPWNCCKYPLTLSESGNLFQMTTLARGEAEQFYLDNGFKACAFDQIPEPYREQCDGCPDKEQCNPIPMIYFGGK